MELFPSVTPRTIKDTKHPYDFLEGAGLFTVASPDGFGASGTGTSVTYVSPITSDGIAGKWAKVTKTNGSSAVGSFNWTSWSATCEPTVTVGDKYRFSGTMYMDGAWDVDATAATYVQVVVEGYTVAGFVKLSTDLIVNRWDGLGWITLSGDFTVPAAADGLRFRCFLNGTSVGDQNVYMAEMSAINLTTMGMVPI